jgi:hypothetical protein
MPLSKKTKNILLIASISVISLIAVVGIFVVINFSKDSGYLETMDFNYQGGVTPSYEEPYAFEDSVTERSMELDALNYDESNRENKIRKSGTVNLTVENLNKANDEVQKVLYNYNGSVVSSNESGIGNNRTVSLTLKVPVEYFEDTYQSIKEVNGEVSYASYYTDDVTQEYIDLESRLRNLEATEEQLVKILETAETVEDTLAVYNQLSSTRSQIEVIKGQLKYLDNQVDYSYLTVTLSLSDVGKEVKDEKWEPLGVFKNAFSALVQLGIKILDSFIWIFVFSPVILIPLLIIFLIVKKRKKGKK